MHASTGNEWLDETVMFVSSVLDEIIMFVSSVILGMNSTSKQGSV